MSRPNPVEETNSKKGILPILVVIILPILGYWFYCSYLKPISAYYQDYDPEFQYFLNSLAILRGGSYTYIDHPGTPLEVIGSVILLATRLFFLNNPGGFTLYHLEHPELFLGITRGLIALLSLGCAWLFYQTARFSNRLWGGFLAAALSMMFYVMHPDSFATLTLWSHNSFNFAFGTLLLVLLFSILRTPGGVSRWKLMGIGVGIGLLTSITIYFAAWIAGTAFALGIFYRLQKLSWKETVLAEALFIAASLAGFVLGTLPVLDLYPAFAKWMIGLIFHQGIYGGGAAGITSPASLLRNSSNLVRDLPVLFITIGLELILLAFAWMRWRKTASSHPGAWAMAGGLTLMLLLVMVAVAKHPGDIYMLAGAAILPVLMMAILDIFQNDPSLYHTLGRILTLLLLGGLAISFSAAILNRSNYANRIQSTDRQTWQAIQSYGTSIGQSPENMYIDWTYGTYSPCQSLQFGDNGTSPEITDDINILCDHQRGVSIWANRVKAFQKRWDILITRTDFLETYPFLKDLGAVYKELPETTDKFGSIVLISNTR